MASPMAKQALNVFIKIALLALTMLVVVKTVHYDELVYDYVSQRISYDDANKIEIWISGEPYPEPYDSINFYISFLVNTLISVPVMSLILSLYNMASQKTGLSAVPKEWAISCLRRLAKIFLFIFLFGALLRFLPYDSLFPNEKTYSAFTIAAAVGFNVLMTIVCYVFIKKIITAIFTRRLQPARQ
jgi:hypothetical protein